MKAGGKRDRSRLVDRTRDRNWMENRVIYDMMLQFSGWVRTEQKGSIWCKEVNSRLISRSDQQLALLRSLGDCEHQIAALWLAHRGHRTLKFHSALNKFILGHTCTTPDVSLSTISFHPEHQRDNNNKKKKVHISCNSRGYTCVSSFVIKLKCG